jgi:Zn-dependent M16 (insulinase) family peptidase
LTLAPDQQMAKDQENKVMAELRKVKKNLSASDIEKIDQDAEALRLQQESTEDVSCLPTLEREDIPPSVSAVAETATDGSLSTTVYDQSTSGIFYFVAAAGAGTLSLPMITLTTFYCYALSRIGTDLRDYADMARRLDTYPGAIGISTHARIRYDAEGACLPFVSLNAKCLYRNQGRMFEIIQELLHHFDFSDLLRLKSLLMEYRAQLESMIVHNGHRLAISLASRKFSVTRALSEMWGGVHHLQTIKNLTENLNDDKLSAISKELTAIGKTIFTRQNLQTAVIGESATLPAAKASIELIRNEFADTNGDGFRAPTISLEDGTIREGWSTNSAVSFVAQTFETVRMAHADAPALSVISKILRSMYLHREIREKGGAYGGFSIYNPEDGLFCFGSYRDPHVISTLKVYQQAADFIRSSSYDEEDIKEAVLQVCSEIDKPDPPGPAARKAFYRKIISLSDDMRGQFKNRLLSLTRKHIKQAADAYFDPQAGNHAVAVISGEEKLKAANQKLSQNPLVLHRI